MSGVDCLRVSRYWRLNLYRSLVDVRADCGLSAEQGREQEGRVRG